ncbi:MAG: hypothetical protein JOZ69_24235, partial [Myxococcales bacterium]|nr:hypothetical protein [Myxococcales bacterium]
ADLLDRGERLAADGKLEAALAAFTEGATEAPESALFARRECETLARLDRRTEAQEACLRALRNEGSAMDMRALVGVLVAGKQAPTPGELAQAMRLARRARDSMPFEPWGYAATCDIAARIGDVEMQEGCLRQLQRYAPGHDETLRALSIAGSRGMTLRMWGAWMAIAALGLGTLAHAAWASLRRRGRRSGVLAAASGVLVCVAAIGPSSEAFAQAAPAAEPAPSAQPAPSAEPTPGAQPVRDPAAMVGRMLSDWPVDDKDPESSVPTVQQRERNPLQFGYWLMDLTFKASAATRRGDHEAAIRYYKALVKAVSDRSVSFTRLCEAYEAAGEWQDALQACGAALTREGVTIQDYTHYFKLALAKKGSLSAQEVAQLDQVLEHLRTDPAGKEVADDLECQLGVRLEDTSRLERCTQALAAKAPDDPRTISFEWALAMNRGDEKQAEALIERARASAMKPDGVEEMVRAVETFRADRRHMLYAWSFGGLAVVLAGGGLLIFFLARRKPVEAHAT